MFDKSWISYDGEKFIVAADFATLFRGILDVETNHGATKLIVDTLKEKGIEVDADPESSCSYFYFESVEDADFFLQVLEHEYLYDEKNKEKFLLNLFYAQTSPSLKNTLIKVLYLLSHYHDIEAALVELKLVLESYILQHYPEVNILYEEKLKDA